MAEVEKLQWPERVKKVTALINAQVVIARYLRHCAAKRKVTVSQTPGHILWGKALGLTVATAGWLHRDPVLALQEPGLCVAFKPVSHGKKLSVYVARAVPRSSFEYHALDHAASLPNSKWYLIPTVEDYNAKVRKKEAVLHTKHVHDIHKLIETHACVQRARSSRGTFAPCRQHPTSGCVNGSEAVFPCRPIRNSSGQDLEMWHMFAH